MTIEPISGPQAPKIQNFDSRVQSKISQGMSNTLTNQQLSLHQVISSQINQQNKKDERFEAVFSLSGQKKKNLDHQNTKQGSSRNHYRQATSYAQRAQNYVTNPAQNSKAVNQIRNLNNTQAIPKRDVGLHQSGLAVGTIRKSNLHQSAYSKTTKFSDNKFIPLPKAQSTHKMDQETSEALGEEDLKIEDVSQGSPIKKKRELHQLPRPTFELGGTGKLGNRVSTPQTAVNSMQKAGQAKESKQIHSSHLNSDIDTGVLKVDTIGEKIIKGSKSTGQRSQQASVLNSLNTEEYKNSLKVANKEPSHRGVQDKSKDFQNSSVVSNGRPPVMGQKPLALGKPQLSRNTKERQGALNNQLVSKEIQKEKFDNERSKTLSTRGSDQPLAEASSNPSTLYGPLSTIQGPNPSKTAYVVPSTGGSDEDLPSKPYRSASNTQKVTMLPQPQTQQSQENPLKNFESAKFASKVHGLITSYSANTHQGIQRNYNEDRVSIILNMTKPSSRKDVQVWPKSSYFAIYDGHGGHNCSDFLKDQLHLIIINQESFPKDPAQALTTGCLEAERMFMSNADKKTPMHDRSGSCAIIVLIVEQECYVANVGDSRAIMSADKGKKLFLLSRDHRPNEEYELQRIVKNGGGIYQTQSIQNVQVQGQTQQQYVLGPHRVLPGRLSVSRTFGDIEAKNPKYGGKEGVVIAQPEISQFTLKNDFHDFIVLGCDGIFDRMTNQHVLDVTWDTINSIRSQEIKEQRAVPQTVHQVSGAMADAVIKQAAIERSLDNLTIVIVSFQNLQAFLTDRPQPQKLEPELFQIKEIDSGTVSVCKKDGDVDKSRAEKLDEFSDKSQPKVDQKLSISKSIVMKKRNDSQANLRFSQQSPVHSKNPNDKKSQKSLQNSIQKYSVERSSGASTASAKRWSAKKVSQSAIQSFKQKQEEASEMFPKIPSVSEPSTQKGRPQQSKPQSSHIGTHQSRTNHIERSPNGYRSQKFTQERSRLKDFIDNNSLPEAQKQECQKETDLSENLRSSIPCIEQEPQANKIKMTGSNQVSSQGQNMSSIASKYSRNALQAQTHDHNQIAGRNIKTVGEVAKLAEEDPNFDLQRRSLQITSKNVYQNPGDFHVISPVGNYAAKLQDFNTETRQEPPGMQAYGYEVNQAEQTKPFYQSESHQSVNPDTETVELNQKRNQTAGHNFAKVQLYQTERNLKDKLGSRAKQRLGMLPEQNPKNKSSTILNQQAAQSSSTVIKQKQVVTMSAKNEEESQQKTGTLQSSNSSVKRVFKTPQSHQTQVLAHKQISVKGQKNILQKRYDI